MAFYRRAAILITSVAGAAVIACGLWLAHRKPAPIQKERRVAVQPAPEPQTSTETLVFEPGDTLEDVLRRSGLEASVTTELSAAVGAAFDVRKFRAGSNLSLTRSITGGVEGLEYLIDPDHTLELSQDGGQFHASIKEVPGTVRAVPVCATLQGSLFESMERIGESPELAIRTADIFAWQLDFNTDPQEGDEFCALVEKKEYENRQPATYQRILATTYKNSGTLYDAYLFTDAHGTAAYYSRDGRSLQSAFLRSPLRFEARISSHFSAARRHPILKIVRPHMGTDYAAPTGTPVQTIGAGTVAFAARSAESGNLVEVRHANGYETRYSHLSRILVRRGQRVEQGQRIGLVGATGLATGPHLDFRFLQNGAYVNFERLKIPPAASISPGRMAEFRAERDHYIALMNSAGQAPETTLAVARPGEAVESAQ